MKAGGDKGAGHSRALESHEVETVAHAASRVDLAARGDVADGSESIEIRAGAATDSPKSHDNQPVGPARHVIQERQRPLKRPIAKIQRQDDAVMLEETVH